MGLKEYEYRGATYQFDEDNAPDGAVEVKQAEKRENKQAPKPQNKQRTPKNKR